MMPAAARLRSALSGLTTRGRSFLSAGVAAAVCALVLGQADLLRVAALLLALPLGCALMVTRARYRLGLTRTVSPERVSAGQPVRVRLELQNLARSATRVLLAEDEVPGELGQTPRFVLDRLPSGQRAAVSYSLQPPQRGRYAIGPLRLRIADPFGLYEQERSFTATDQVVVIPRLWRLSGLEAGGLWGGAGDSLARAAAVSGEDDIATREYRQGDDLRRVHWRSTARRGELMVRREEQPRQMRATVLLDTRRRAFHGSGPDSSFEWAVSAAASAATHFTGARHGVRLVLDGRPAGWTNPHSGDAAGLLLDDLAVVHEGDDDVLDGALGVLRRGGGDGVVVAVLGDLGEDHAGTLGRLARDGVPGIALLVRTGDWAGAETTSGVMALDQRLLHAWEVLHDGGWRVVEAGRGETVTDVWTRALGPAGLQGPPRRAGTGHEAVLR